MAFEDYLNQKYGGGSSASNGSFESYLAKQYGNNVSTAEPVVQNQNVSYPRVNRITNNDPNHDVNHPTNFSEISAIPTDTRSVVEKYESIPEYNIFERMFDKRARSDYKEKQSLQSEYEIEKDNQVRGWLKDNGLTANDVVGGSLYSDAIINKMLEGKGFSKEQIKAISDYADRQRNAYNLKNIENFGEEHKVAGTLLSVPTNLIGGVDTAIESGINYLAGKPMSTTTNANFVSDVTNTLRDKATENMGTVGKTLYGAGTSVADMALAALSGGAYVMGLEKAGSTMRDATERGLNPTQTIAEGLASGITTAITEGKVFENIGESLTKGIVTKEGESAIKAIAKQILKTGLMEGGQEVAEGSLDILADQLIANLLSRENKSSLNQDYQTYLSSGMSKNEAVKAVIGDTVKSGVADFVGGFLAGGAMQAPAIAIGQINTAGERRAAAEQQRLVEEAEAQRIAEEENQRIEEARQNRFAEEQRANQNELPYLLDTARAQAEAEAREAQERADRRAKLDNDFNAFLEEQRAKLNENIPSVEEPLNEELITNKEYNSENFDDSADLNKVINDHTNMYGGERAPALKAELKKALNEYADTKSPESLARVREITNQLEGIFTDKYYTKKRQSKNPKSKNAAARQDKRIYYPGNRGTITENVERYISDTENYQNGTRGFANTPNANIDENINNIADKMRRGGADPEAYDALYVFRDMLNNYQQTGDESYLDNAVNVFNDLVEDMGPDFYNTVALDFETAFNNVANTTVEIGSNTDEEVSTAKEKTAQFVQDVMNNKGITSNEHNIIRLFNASDEVSDMVYKASGGDIDISNKVFALEGSKLYHELISHGDANKEANRGQLPLDANDIQNAVEGMAFPDIVENVSNGINDQKKKFAFVKITDGYIVVVESVGGNRNPTIVPEQIIKCTQKKMQDILDGKKSIGEVVYENTPQKKKNVGNVTEDIKKRVTAAPNSNPSISKGTTSETGLRSPLDSRVSDDSQNVNTIPSVMAEDTGLNPRTTDKDIPSLTSETTNQRLNETDVLNDVKDSINFRESQYATNTLKRSETFFAQSKEAAKELDKERKKGTFYKETTSEAESMEAARRMVEQDPDGIRETIMNAPDISNVQIDASALLINEAIASGNYEEAFNMADAVANKTGQAARGLQALAKYTRSATGVVMKLAKINSLFGKKLNMSQEDMAEIKRLFDEAEQYDINSKNAAELHEQAYAIAAKYLPDTTFMDKWNSWRYLAMLGNVRTHIRNIFGNTAFGAVTNIKDAVGAAIESATLRDGQERSKAVVSRAVDGDLFNGASQYYDDFAYGKATAEGNKYSMENEIRRQQKPFKSELLNKINKLNSDKLTEEDNRAIKRKYVRALAGYVKANGYDSSIFTSKNEADIEFLRRASDYAVNQAKVATFHEDNAIANFLNNVAQNAARSDNKGVNFLGFLMESVMPFKKTPANVLKQGVLYSPAGFIDTISKVKNKEDVTEIIDSLSRASTGTMILGLGALLAAKGIIKGGLDDDDELLGEQEYSINIGNHSYTIDWLAPAALPLFVGAELYNAYEGDESFFDALTSLAEPVVEMSMLQGLKTTLNSVASGFSSNQRGTNPLIDVVSGMAIGYASQGIPTIVGQTARTIDPMRRSVYTKHDGSLGSLEYQAEKIQNKIPGLSMLNQPYVNEWGEEERNTGGNVFGRALNNMALPGYYSNTERNALQSELESLGTEDVSLMPDKVKRKYEGRKLTDKEFHDYQQRAGKNFIDFSNAIINSANYNGLTDDQKRVVLSDISKLAGAITKNEMFGYKIDESSSYKKAYEIYKEKGINGLANYYVNDTRIKTIVNKEKGTEPILKALDSLRMTDTEKGEYLYDKMADPIKAAEIAYEDNGYDAFYKAYQIKYDADTDGNSSMSQDELIKYLYGSDMSIDEKYYWFDTFFPDAKKIPVLY